MARVKVDQSLGSASTAERIERELRAYNKDKRINSMQHAAAGIKPPTFEWAKNDWLVATIAKKVGKGE